jgi:transposase-like protein
MKVTTKKMPGHRHTVKIMVKALKLQQKREDITLRALSSEIYRKTGVYVSHKTVGEWARKFCLTEGNTLVRR